MSNAGTKYDFKVVQEAAFAGVTALAILGFEILASLDIVNVLADPKTWGIMVVGSAARAFGAAAVNLVLRRAAS